MSILDIFRKASPATSELLDPKISRALLLPWQDGKPLFKTQEFQLQLEANTKWVYRCVQIIANSCSATPFKLYTMKNSGNQVRLFNHKSVDRRKTEWLEAHNPAVNRVLKKSGELVELTEHPFYDLMRSVNPHMNEQDIKKLKWVSHRLTGNAYWYKVKDGTNRPIRLWPLSTPNISIIPSSKTFIAGYEYRIGSNKIFFEESEIIHFKDPTPNDPFYGAGPLAAAVDSVTLQRYMDKFNIDLFHNRGVPETVLSTSADLSDSTVERILKRWKEKLGFSHGRTGEPIVLGSGLRPERLTMSPQEVHYIESANLVRLEICGLFGVPITKIDPSQVNANNDVSNKMFLEDTIYPLLIQDQEKLNEKLLPDYDERLVGAYENPIPDDREFKLKEDVEHVKAGIRTRDEVRATEGMEPLPNGQGESAPPFRGQYQDNVEVDTTAKFIEDIAINVRKKLYSGK